MQLEIDMIEYDYICVNRYVSNSTVAANSTEENQNDTALTFVITAK